MADKSIKITNKQTLTILPIKSRTDLFIKNLTPPAAIKSNLIIPPEADTAIDYEKDIKRHLEKNFFKINFVIKLWPL